MSKTVCEVRPGAYYDSVVLMQLQRQLADLPGVKDAGAVMATPANRELLASSGLEVDVEAGPDDLLIAVKADDEPSAGAALAAIDEILASRRSRSAQTFRPRSLETAARALPDATWVMISVPGRYAAEVARQALALDKHVFLYSDNVSLEDEIELKREAQQRGLLIMGPDCGTAIISGVGLGFANNVRQGRVGIIAASGTGLQTIAVRLHELGGGVSQAIGTGGRDLDAQVGGPTSLQALGLLAADPETECIILVSKPPSPQVAATLLQAGLQCGKPVVVDFIGFTAGARQIGNLHFAGSLADAAELALAATVSLTETRAEARTHDPASPLSQPGYLRGLFSGGTLAYEACLTLSNFLTPLYSNLKVAGAEVLEDVHSSQSHTIVDLGEDEFTQGRLHPMLDNDLRLRRLKQEAADPEARVIMLDVVLGHGAHPDPASELAPEIARILTSNSRVTSQLKIVVVMVGTEEDPQNLREQVAQFEEAGAEVFEALPEALTYVASHLVSTESAPEIQLEPLTAGQPLAAINVGVEMFHDSLESQGARVVHVDWRPPAAGDERMMALLTQLKSK